MPTKPRRDAPTRAKRASPRIYFRDLMEAKKRGKALTRDQIAWFVAEYSSGNLPDYQAAALLAAIWFKGLNENELWHLTAAMVDSGETVSFRSDYGKPLVDKHSTGGIGDKVTLALAPLLACFGLGVAKMSGRGLGFTGGTIDKLESVGVKTGFSVPQAKKLLAENDVFVISQTPELVPADKLLYALRDVTATVDSLPLIAASVVSKKMALATDYVFLDVKYGAGAFCRTKADARRFAALATGLAKRFRRRVKCELTPMQQVLGRAVGNAIEVKEAADYLAGRGEPRGDFARLMEELAADVLTETGKFSDAKAAVAAVRAAIRSGAAIAKMTAWISAQGGNAKAVADGSCFAPAHKLDVLAPASGHVSYPDVVALAELGVDLGAGRRVKTDALDFQAGIWLHAKHGERVAKGAPVLTLSASKPISAELAARAAGLFDVGARPAAQK